MSGLLHRETRVLIFMPELHWPQPRRTGAGGGATEISQARPRPSASVAAEWLRMTKTTPARRRRRRAPSVEPKTIFFNETLFPLKPLFRNCTLSERDRCGLKQTSRAILFSAWNNNHRWPLLSAFLPFPFPHSGLAVGWR